MLDPLEQDPAELVAAGEHVVGPLQADLDAGDPAYGGRGGDPGQQRQPRPPLGRDVPGHEQERDGQRAAGRGHPLAAQPPAAGGLVLGDEHQPLLLAAAEAVGDVGVGRGGLLDHLHPPRRRRSRRCPVNRWAAVLVIASCATRLAQEHRRSSEVRGVRHVSAAPGEGTEVPEDIDIHTTEGKLADLDRRIDEAVHAGSAKAVEKQHAKGKMDRPRAHRAALRRGLVRRARRAGPAPLGRRSAWRRTGPTATA